MLQVQHGWGFQTWEYSPVYALRSYLFLLPHVVVTSAISSVVGSKVVAFYCARCAQGFCSHTVLVADTQLLLKLLFVVS